MKYYLNMIINVILIKIKTQIKTQIIKKNYYNFNHSTLKFPFKAFAYFSPTLCILFLQKSFFFDEK